ncbi:hypothetical protein MAA_01588 [Metarhizium robertsii ARSEF 23]|uniref:Uncharacterized protein n=1 Tax=Metarhizium robertsii (strain ARSEF 23 / ATCC MYA-3075) TaxID=655844 RepID=E9EM86_METRA|nr:uncharacterized protein MAA_01588 [Metarhizium robertsii ARSEF 23]EFZ04514.1 hypothetical protein MAA_01588 [Metarhizium robertsii ARSEF 23]
MDLAHTVLSCLFGSLESTQNSAQHAVSETRSNEVFPSPHRYSSNAKKLSIDLVTLLRRSDVRGEELWEKVDQTVGSAGWSELLAENVLKALESTLKESHEKMGTVMKEAYDNAVEAAEHEFQKLVQQAKENPLELAATILVTIVAFGVLAALAPFIVELLGFGELGPAAGEFPMANNALHWLPKLSK